MQYTCLLNIHRQTVLAHTRRLACQSLGAERGAVLQCEAHRLSELVVLLMSGRQVELVEAGVCDRVDDVVVERQNHLRRKIRRPTHELDQVAQVLLRYDAQNVPFTKPTLTRAQNPRQHCFLPRDLDLWSFDSKINGFPGLMMEHFSVKFGDPSCSGLWDIVRNKRIDRQTNVVENHTPPLP